jgi:hypothetical protein
MIVQVSHSSADSIIIIEDVATGVSLSVKVGRMDFELSGSNHKIIEIGTTTLTPTVITNATGFEFDVVRKLLKVTDTSNAAVHTTSTNNKTVLVKVDFNSTTITVYE